MYFDSRSHADEQESSQYHDFLEVILIIVFDYQNKLCEKHPFDLI